MNLYPSERLFILIVPIALLLGACGGSSSDGNVLDDGNPGQGSEIPGDIAEEDNAGIPGDVQPQVIPVPGSEPIPGDVSSAGNDNAPALLVGVFIDSAVEGVSYRTASQSGVTNANGEFSYIAGELVTFSIGNLDFPTIPAADIVTPIEMAMGTPDTFATTTNIARLVQSLDLDGNPDNGILIPQTAAASATALDFTMSIEDFETNPDCLNLVANSGSVNTSLISAYAANLHLAKSLGDDAIPGS